MLESLGLISSILIGAATIAWSLNGVKKQMWLQSFLEFTGRYNQLVEKLPSLVRSGDPTATLEQLTDSEHHQVENAVRGYLNLCSEELYLVSRGHLDKQTWSIWKDGIRAFFESGISREVWADIRSEYESYEEFTTLVDQMGGCIETELGDN